jgi:hypothetical protein
LQIIPRAIDYFTGKVFEYEGIDDSDADYDDLDDDEEEGVSDNDVCVSLLSTCELFSGILIIIRTGI